MKQKISETKYLFRTTSFKTPSQIQPSEERELELKDHEFSDTVTLTIRVIISEQSRSTIQLSCSCNDKVKAIAEEIAEFFNENKYKLSFVSETKQIKLSDSIAELGITQLLCLKGGEHGPKIFQRFTTIDDPCRQLSYMADEMSYEAISFVPTRDVTFVGFSVYPVMSSKEDFTCHWRYKIGDQQGHEHSTDFNHERDVKGKMCDVMLDKEINVRAHEAITICVRFTQGQEFFCTTLLGYGGENYEGSIPSNEPGAFLIEETEACTKFETDRAFG